MSHEHIFPYRHGHSEEKTCQNVQSPYQIPKRKYGDARPLRIDLAFLGVRVEKTLEKSKKLSLFVLTKAYKGAIIKIEENKEGKQK